MDRPSRSAPRTSTIGWRTSPRTTTCRSSSSRIGGSPLGIVFVYDLLFKNALVFDGTGSPPSVMDVAVKDRRVRELGRDVSGAARQTINAAGLALMPGIIDSHTHFDAQITWDAYVRPSPALGVTTAVIGNCGFTIAPCKPADREITMRNLTQVEGMSLDVLRQGIAWDFETFPQYLGELRRKGSAV